MELTKKTTDPKRAASHFSVELSIGELVLHGFPPGDGLRIGDAIELELKSQFEKHGIPETLAHSADILSLDGGGFDAEPGARSEVIGTQTARAVYRGLDFNQKTQ